MAGMLERMEENWALAGVMSSVETLSPAFRATWALIRSDGGVLTGSGLMLGPRMISTLALSSGAQGGISIRSSTG